MKINCQLFTKPEVHMFITNELVWSSCNEIITEHYMEMSALQYQDVCNNFYVQLLLHHGQNINITSAVLT